MKAKELLAKLLAEKEVLDASVDSIGAVLSKLNSDLPNVQKDRALVRLVEARHWLRDAQASLEHSTVEIKKLADREDAPELFPDGCANPPPSEN